MATFGNIETEVEPLAGLIREHTEMHELVTRAREATEEAIEGRAEDAGRAALEVLRDLEAFMAVDLMVHIAKEEEVLFPALRGFDAYTDQVVDEMVEQHDEVRLRQQILAKALEALDKAHEEVADAKAGLSASLRKVNGTMPTVAELEELLDGVKRLDWIMQGHFGDEEDDLFVPALELLSAETFAELAVRAKALEG